MKTDHKLLIIDDNRDLLHMMEHVLIELGYRPLCYTNTEIIADVAEIKPSIIFLDVKLLDANGLDICKKLKSDVETASIPVVLISASNKLASIADECKADAFISKPFDINEIESIVNRLTSSPS